MGIEQNLQNEIEDAKRWIQSDADESTYKRDLKKRVELINLGFRTNEKFRYLYLRNNSI
ncbi:MAG TPA: hypothetical protein VJS91_07620 [Nitrososphaeraceae archaeon]|nr:hypothetical protein [Nitrososphaeraceae archaeon]